MKKLYQHTPSTAHKKSVHFSSRYNLQSTPTAFSNHENRRKPIQKNKDHLKQTIDSLINMVKQKRTQQHAALDKVYQTNSQIYDYLTSEQEIRASSYEPDTRSGYSAPLRNHQQKYSQYEDASTYFERKRSQVLPSHPDLNQQNYRLRNQLSAHIRQNSELCKKIKKLQDQQQYLQYQQNQNNNSSLYEQQNRKLKQQLHQLNKISNQSNQYTMKDLLQQFNQLKQQNQKLREETINMLKCKKNMNHQDYYHQYDQSQIQKQWNSIRAY